MVTSNHTGQIAIDGMLLSTAFVMDVFPPRILRPMVERFFTALPFIAPWAAEGGSVLGDRTNALNLLKKGQSVMVFPEGVKGITKSTHEFYKMKPFTRGFYRMCVPLRIPEIYQLQLLVRRKFFLGVHHPRMIQKALGLPDFPLSLNYFPLPSPIDIHIGEPIQIPKGLDQDSPDKDIDEQVFIVEKAIKDLIENGLNRRRPFFANAKSAHKKMIKLSDIKSILIIGAGGGLAKLTASLIAQKYPDISILGVDPRDTDFLIRKENIKYQRMKYTWKLRKTF